MRELLYSDILKKSWQQMSPQLPLFAALSMVVGLAISVAVSLPFFGLIVVGPVMLGYFKCVDQLRKGNSIDFADFFWGFTDLNRFLHAVLMFYVMGFGVGLGLVFLIIPGIWFAVVSSFSLPIFVLHKQDGLAAIRKSMNLVERRWWNVAAFIFVLLILNFLGSLCFLLGLLVTTPITVLSLLIACEELLAQEQNSETSSSEPQSLEV